MQPAHKYKLQCHLAYITLVVRDYDEALASRSASSALRWSKTRLSQNRTNAGSPSPTRRATPRRLLARAATPAQAARIGDQTGGRVAFFLHTDDFARDHARFTAASVAWVRPPVDQPYGRVAVFRDLYGNLWDLIESALPRA